MTKEEFLAQLRNALLGLPPRDIEERLSFYGEMIDDRVEDGILEADAVSEVGSVNAIAAQIIADIPLAKIAKERMKPKRQLCLWEIVLLALGSPLWLSLGIAAVALFLSLYVSVWSLIVSMWAVFVSLAACSLGFVLGGISFVCSENTVSGISVIAAGLICAGLSVFAFYGCKAATKGVLALTKKLALWIKNCFIRKGEAS